MGNLEIKVKYTTEIDKEFKELEGISQGDWIDLRVAEDYNLKRGDFKLLRLGVCMQLPEGYEAHVCSRSSTFKKYGIFMSNSMGIIDNSYCGDTDEWLYAAIATKDVVIPRGTRIAQFRLERIQPNISFVKVDKLEGESRGGFGSTGEK